MTKKLSRRDTLAGIGLMALAPPVFGLQDARANDSSPPIGGAVRDGVLLDEFIRLRTSPDGAAVRWVYSGLLMLKVEGELARPAVRIEGMSRAVATRRAEGGWTWVLDEAGWYCDLETGAVLERWRNPITDREVTPKPYRSPQTLIFTEAGVLPGQALPSGTDFRGEIRRFTEVGHHLALTEDLYVRVPGRGVYASLATFTAPRAALRDRNDWVDCKFSYTTLNSFVGWLGMADVPGVQDMRLAGFKCRTSDRAAIPDALHARLQSQHPALLER